MDAFNSQRKRVHRARQRRMARQRRRALAEERLSIFSRLQFPGLSTDVGGHLSLIARDIWWHLTHNWRLLQIIGAIAATIAVIFVASHLFSGQIFPNIWSLGQHLGDMTVEEAETLLLSTWYNDMQISLMAEGVELTTVSPPDLGLQLDARQTADAARAAGLSGIPFGTTIEPVVTLDFATAQRYLLGITESVYRPPLEAGFTWQDNQLAAVDGVAGRALDVALTMERLAQDPIGIILSGRLDLSISSLPPNVVDSSNFLSDAMALVSQPFQFVGYDPVINEYLHWSIPPQDLTRWIAAGPTSLTLRDDVFQDYVEMLSEQVGPNPFGDERFLNPTEAYTAVYEAIRDGLHEATVRIRYMPGQYMVQSGDVAFAIARKTGLPFYLIETANPGRDMNSLFVGDTIYLPSRDEVMPEDVVPNKRIVVNLDTQMLYAFEDGQLVFYWKISSGVSQAPTSPGIFQILTHEPVAYGSSYSLCQNDVCGQWVMNWFMGIYEVTPGLMNGFHGAVSLPNGTYLGGGTVGQPYTFGCIMSRDEQGKLLYDWAEIGTVVEIISRDFQPMSDLGRWTLEQGPMEGAA